MRTSSTHQLLNYDIRLSDEAQADALRLLDASRSVVNQALILLWPYLDEFGSERAGPAWKVLLLLAHVHGCPPLSIESLKTLKSTGRGRGARGRWRNYRNNAAIRGEIWRLLRHKCHLVGSRFQTCPPRGTSHTGPHCGISAKTYRSPSDRKEAVKWGCMLYCETCHYNGDRDYCASVNSARLGLAYLVQMKHTGRARSCSITDPIVKPVSYTGAGAVLLLPPQVLTPTRCFRERLATTVVGTVQFFCNHLSKNPFF